MYKAGRFVRLGLYSYLSSCRPFCTAIRSTFTLISRDVMVASVWSASYLTLMLGVDIQHRKMFNGSGSIPIDFRVL